MTSNAYYKNNIDVMENVSGQQFKCHHLFGFTYKGVIECYFPQHNIANYYCGLRHIQFRRFIRPHIR